MIDNRTRKQYSPVILGLIHGKQWHQRERDEAVQRPPVLRVAQFVEGPDDLQDAPRRALLDTLVVRKVGDELEYGWLDVWQKVLACRGEDGTNSVDGDFLLHDDG